MADSQLLFIVNHNSKKGPAIHKKLKRLNSGLIVELTKSPEEADWLIESVMERFKNPKIIFAGGDGMVNYGYCKVHELQQLMGTRPTVAVIPAGNANDHYRSIFGNRSLRSMLRAIESDQTRPLDLIQITIGNVKKLAVSYASWGKVAYLTAIIHDWQRELRGTAGRIEDDAEEGEGLPEATKRRHQWFIHELHVVGKGLRPMEPFGLDRGRGEERLLNLSIHSVRGMAKLLTPAPKADPFDGVLEVLEHGSGRFDLLRFLGYATLAKFGVSHPWQLARDEPLVFTLRNGGKPVDLQRDGEPELIEDDQEVISSCLRGALNTAA